MELGAMLSDEMLPDELAELFNIQQSAIANVVGTLSNQRQIDKCHYSNQIENIVTEVTKLQRFHENMQIKLQEQREFYVQEINRVHDILQSYHMQLDQFREDQINKDKLREDKTNLEKLHDESVHIDNPVDNESNLPPSSLDVPSPSVLSAPPSSRNCSAPSSPITILSVSDSPNPLAIEPKIKETPLPTENILMQSKELLQSTSIAEVSQGVDNLKSYAVFTQAFPHDTPRQLPTSLPVQMPSHAEIKEMVQSSIDTQLAAINFNKLISDNTKNKVCEMRNETSNEANDSKYMSEKISLLERRLELSAHLKANVEDLAKRIEKQEVISNDLSSALDVLIKSLELDQADKHSASSLSHENYDEQEEEQNSPSDYNTGHKNAMKGDIKDKQIVKTINDNEEWRMGELPAFFVLESQEKEERAEEMSEVISTTITSPSNLSLISPEDEVPPPPNSHSVPESNENQTVDGPIPGFDNTVMTGTISKSDNSSSSASSPAAEKLIVEDDTKEKQPLILDDHTLKKCVDTNATAVKALEVVRDNDSLDRLSIPVSESEGFGIIKQSQVNEPHEKISNDVAQHKQSMRTVSNLLPARPVSASADTRNVSQREAKYQSDEIPRNLNKYKFNMQANSTRDVRKNAISIPRKFDYQGEPARILLAESLNVSDNSDLLQRIDNTEENELHAQIHEAESANSPNFTKEELRQLWIRTCKQALEIKSRNAIMGTLADTPLFRKQYTSVGSRMRRLEETVSVLEESLNNLWGASQRSNDIIKNLSVDIDQMKKTNEPNPHSYVEKGQQTLSSDELEFCDYKFDIKKVHLDSLKVVDIDEEFNDKRTIRQLSENLVLLAEKVGRLESSEDTLSNRLDVWRDQCNIKNNQLIYNFELMVKDAILELNESQAVIRKDITLEMDKILKRHNFLTMILSKMMALSQTTDTECTEGQNTDDYGHPLRILQVSMDILRQVSEQLAHSMQEANQNYPYQQLEGIADTDNISFLTVIAIIKEKIEYFQDDLNSIQIQQQHIMEELPVYVKQIESTISASVQSQIETLENLINSISHNAKTTVVLLENGNPEVNNKLHDNNQMVNVYLRDAVFNLRSILFLMHYYRRDDLIETIPAIKEKQQNLEKQLTAILKSQKELSSIGNALQMTNTRIDKYLEGTQGFAKEDDMNTKVNSVNEIVQATQGEQLVIVEKINTLESNSLSWTNKLERKLSDIMANLSKVARKDELMWTQDSLEQKLEALASGTLGEDDLLKIQRALHGKVDHTQLRSILQQHRKQIGGETRPSTDAGQTSLKDPLLSNKCISCQGQLPPTKSMVHDIVKEEIQMNLSRVAARQHQYISSPTSLTSNPGKSPSSSFNASTHRRLEAHKKELLHAALLKKFPNGVPKT